LLYNDVSYLKVTKWGFNWLQGFGTVGSRVGEKLCG
jgi:hypothetical protein